MNDLLWSFMHIAIYNESAVPTAAQRLRPSRILGNHLKTGHALSLQNRPTALIQNSSCYTVPECDPAIVIRSGVPPSLRRAETLG
jgi:hypothetical protein